MEITCPECRKSTPLQITEGLCCEHCQTSFEKLKLVKKAFIGTSAALTIGGIVGLKADDVFEKNRYPSVIEYSLLERCSNSTRGIDYGRTAEMRFQICACALKEAQEDFDYSRFNKSREEFTWAMTSAARACAD